MSGTMAGGAKFAEPIEARFARMVGEPDANGCTPWLGRPSDAKGYGRIARSDGSRVMAHRYAWERANGRPVPDDLEIDHLCRNRACVNPAHLEAVSHLVNMRRGERARKTHCPYGHELPRPLAESDPAMQVRDCATCVNRRTREWKRRYRAARSAK